MITMVVDLRTGKEIFYKLRAQEAVVCAYEQYEKRNFNTWLYDFYQAKFSESGETVYCGDFVAIAD